MGQSCRLTLFSCCKKTHSKRLLLIPTEEELNTTRKKIHIDDIEKGIKLFIEIYSKEAQLVKSHVLPAPVPPTKND